MDIGNNINPITKLSFDFDNTPKTIEKQDAKFFEEILSAALTVFNETNDYQKQADIAQLDFATGKNDNMLSVLMAEQKAYTSLDFTVQVTNKVIEAYREIMRIQL